MNVGLQTIIHDEKFLLIGKLAMATLRLFYQQSVSYSIRLPKKS